MKTFIEIGTCDFDTLRPLCDKGWRGVMVEAWCPYLQNIPDHENLTKVCVAVGPENGTAKFWKVKDDVLENSARDYRGMGTIRNNSVLETNSYYEDKVEWYDVNVATFDTIMSKFGITEIDYLKLDTEGMDFKILKTIDYEKYDIKVIKCETKFVFKEELFSFLDEKGYHIESFPNDIIAIKN
jgi:FkbM family methyltransferase